MMKTCINCGGFEFYASRACKACTKAKSKAYAAANPEKVAQGKLDWARANAEKMKGRTAAYRLKNPEKSKAIQAAYRDSNKEKIKASSAAYYAANAEKINARGAEWRASNPEKKKVLSASYYIENIEKIKEYALAYRAENTEKIKAQVASWRASNSDRYKAQAAAWAKANPEKRVINAQNRRARKALSGGTLSNGLSAKLYNLQKGKCPCCSMPLGDSYHLDHIIPLALGGSNTDGNIQLLRAICNLQKNVKHPVEFMQSRGFLV